MQDNNNLQKQAVSQTQIHVLTILRLVIGWHLLYEGIAKLLTPAWTAAPFLSTSRWVFSGFFNWIASDPGILQVADFLNIWGLILIGLGLIFGIFVKTAAVSGIVLLSLYYIAHPPFVGMDFGIPLEGHYLIVNKTLIEIFALAVIAILPSASVIRLDHYILHLLKKIKNNQDTLDEERKQAVAQTINYNRREMLKNLALLPIVGTFFYGAYKKYNWEKANAITGATIKLSDTRLTDLKGELPSGHLGNLEISRLTLGCNLIGGWSHSRDLLYVSSLFKAYNTEKKVYETLEIAEKAGINTMNIVNNQFPILHKYLNISGGKMQTICQVYPELDDKTTDIDKAIDNGTTTLYVQGGWCDRFVQEGHVNFLAETIDYIKSQGYLAGIGAHSIQVPMACEKAGINPDYYVKTLHHDQYWSAHPREFRTEFSVDRQRYTDHNKFHDNMFDLFPDQTIAFMKSIDKPWIAFKVLAGGAISPQDGFNYAFENGADFICVGMFDFQIVDDVNIAIDVLSNLKKRERPWIA
jgi:uncharacterized membrane protein YphA (DoxX/SURF4 family)